MLKWIEAQGNILGDLKEENYEIDGINVGKRWQKREKTHETLK